MNHEKMLRQLELHEGFRSFPYRDTVGKLTIGIGRNLDDVGITMSEAFFMLEHDIRKAIKYLENFAWYLALDEVRQRVIVDMVFNLGANGFSKFKRTIQALKDQDYDKASEQMLKSLWARQVGTRAVRLAEMMRTGIDYNEQEHKKS